jgi:Zn-dependent protease
MPRSFVTSSLPSLRFRILGFPVSIDLFYLFVVLFIGLGARPGVYILEWLIVVTFSILIHELGHALTYRHYNIHPEIRLWGLGGLTVSGFALPPRKSILVSLAGPLFGIPVGLFVMVVRPWLPADNLLLWYATADLIFINLGWAIVNLLPLAGLDGGHVVESAFVLARGQSGRTPGQVVVAVCSVAIAIVAVVIGFPYLAIIIAMFALLNPEPFMTTWRLVRGGRGPKLVAPPKPQIREEKRESRRDRPAAIVAVESKRAFAEAYAETLPAPIQGAPAGAMPSLLPGSAAGGVGEAPLETTPQTGGFDLDELVARPVPLLPDVAAMVARRDDPGLAARLGTETDPLAVLWIVTRVVEGKRVPQLLGVLRRAETANRTTALLKLQVALHALGRYDESMAAASLLGRAGGPRSAVLEARSAARSGDRKRTAAALERAIALGPIRLSDAALGDIARIGPDRRVADLLARLRAAPPT